MDRALGSRGDDLLEIVYYRQEDKHYLFSAHSFHANIDVDCVRVPASLVMSQNYGSSWKVYCGSPLLLADLVRTVYSRLYLLAAEWLL